MHEDLKTNTQHAGTSSNQLKSVKVWWRLLRPHTLTASFIPVLIGTALAVKAEHIHIWLFGAMMLASILIQTATNMFNEYYDFKRGLDTSESVGIGGAIVREGIQAKTVLRLALSLFAAAVLLGIYVCFNSSWWIAVVGLICMTIGYLYTGGPYPIAYTPFGELVSGFFMGFIIIVMSLFIQTHFITLESILISIPTAILIGAILMANNIRDFDGDKQNGRRTLAIILGKKKAVQFLTGMFAVSYVWIAFIAILHLASSWVLLAFTSIPKAVKASRGFYGKSSPLEMMPAMEATAQTNTLFGFLLALGILLANWI
ncbi:1,4-dihydroxy-2-naphthoate polyprenyltransferase [Aneurinibacillus terranovensis]|uniref:1,4-dihydroxy-2-naphthoate polyprenyltransferase n=1 Tax=Aneurinibacillus terranovensis TaxID=278991 RepID=UPI00040A0464|nr:1,4-dihydroxy-2-naphthoate polyprenyltransferase [Aneurinibacillus terranovensis]